MKLSVLDQSPISKGQSPEDAIHNSIQLAKEAEKLGYHRYWVAEHHSTNGLACTSPEIMIGQIASQTNRIRVGSGGVLLPQYSPLKVAENFNMLAAFYPSRIDLGVGRSPGGPESVRLALTDGQKKSLSSSPRQVKDLQGFIHQSFPKDHDYRKIKAGPKIEHHPEIWVLGVSERGAKHAANAGVGFTYGHFINSENGKEALGLYREHFKPSPSLTKPKTNCCIFVVCAETQEKAEELALSQDLWLLNVGKGRSTIVPTINEAKNRIFNQEEIEEINKNRRRAIIGTPSFVKERLEELSEEYQTDEFLIITNIYDFNAKLKSYELLANEIL
ncbi:LLM class flavin-dependent oxidoreductase [Piscibacillus halophilus]|uniref:LLM class flavin-dependent oxidoreductase n=1 Tax=Piscibacillus halophilus TaxID=571933 RepID=UPI00158AB8E7|nr:LLM class flavin-dependent oxidoreductase [Piscibacillus halophilus]